MAKLSTAKRDALPKRDFAGPDRSYPVEDKSHARNAKARASQAEHEGRISKGEEARIDAKADRVLGEKGSKTMAEDRKAEMHHHEHKGEVHHHAHVHHHTGERHEHRMEPMKAMHKELKAERKHVRET